MADFDIRYCISSCTTAECANTIPLDINGQPKYQKCFPCVKALQAKAKTNRIFKPLAKEEEAPICAHDDCTSRVKIQIVDPTKFYKHCAACRSALFVTVAILDEDKEELLYRVINEENLDHEDDVVGFCAFSSQTSNY